MVTVSDLLPLSYSQYLLNMKPASTWTSGLRTHLFEAAFMAR